MFGIERAIIKSKIESNWNRIIELTLSIWLGQAYPPRLVQVPPISNFNYLTHSQFKSEEVVVPIPKKNGKIVIYFGDKMLSQDDEQEIVRESLSDMDPGNNKDHPWIM